MLRMIQNRSAAGAKSYFSHADYYAEGQELTGLWGGRTAAQLGLTGIIQQGDFNALCDNKDPRSGSRLTARTRSYRSVGYDINMHVPKGVSLAYMLAGDERILTAFQESVRETMADIEQDASTRVRMDGRQEDRVTGNLVWGEFIHKTARPVDGLPDPHLHAHCFVFNVTFDKREQRYKAVQFRELKRDAGYYEALMHARLARRMKGLGYDIERTGRHWDVANVPKALRDRFSRRRDQIEEIARLKGITDADQKAELGATSRENKQTDLTMPELKAAWLWQLSQDEREQLTVPTDLLSESRDEQRRRAALAVDQAIEHCFERNAVLPERAVLAEALRRGAGEVLPSDIAAETQRQGLIVRPIQGQRMATTAEALQDEREVIEFVRHGRRVAAPLNDNWAFRRDWLSDEQHRAVRQLITSSDRVQVVHGQAGTGKTTLLQEAADAIRAGGLELWTFAPSAEASRGVLREEGFSSATTVAELLINEGLQRTAAGQVWWIDEAGLLSTRQLRDTFQLADRLGARLILSGDWRQHSSVERGGILRQIVDKSGISAVRLSSIRRQRGVYRDAVKAIADGNVAEGFDALDALGWVREIADKKRDATIAREYASAVEKGESCLVVSPTHVEGAHLTAAIREELIQAELLSAVSKTYVRLVPRHLTVSERRDAAFYQPGDVIVFHRNSRRHQKGERYLVTSPPGEELLGQANNFSVFRSKLMAIAPGERIRFTSNVRSICGKHRINNGSIYEVDAVTSHGHLKLANGWEVGRDVGHLDYGYVTTSHGSQGRTVDRVLLAESTESLPAASAQQFYVSISRGRKEARIFTDNKAALRDAVQEVRAGMTATEFADFDVQMLRTAARKRSLEAQATEPQFVTSQPEVSRGYV